MVVKTKIQNIVLSVTYEDTEFNTRQPWSIESIIESRFSHVNQLCFFPLFSLLCAFVEVRANALFLRD